jgi:hypothetical protein
MSPILLFRGSRIAGVIWLAVVYAMAGEDARAQLSGTYHSAPGTTVTYQYQNPGLPTTTLPADITVTFSGDNPTSSLTASIHQPIIGDLPEFDPNDPGYSFDYPIVGFFPMVVTGTSTDGRDFEGMLLDNSQYYFDWQFEPTNSGNLKWTGQVSWIGGRIEISTVDEGALLVPSVAGDFNRNGDVDAADYVVWRNELLDGGLLRADGNQDGAVDAADYDIWKANFGGPAGSALSTNITPEPAAALYLLLGVLPLVMSRHSASR